MNSIEGTYELKTTTNLDEYLVSLGVGYVLRKVCSVCEPEIAIEHTGDEWQVSTESMCDHRVVRFKLGQEFNDVTYDARKCKTIAQMDGVNKMIMVQKCEKGPPVMVTYEIKKAEIEETTEIKKAERKGQTNILVVTMKAEGIEVKFDQIFDKVLVKATD